MKGIELSWHADDTVSSGIINTVNIKLSSKLMYLCTRQRQDYHWNYFPCSYHIPSKTTNIDTWDIAHDTTSHSHLRFAALLPIHRLRHNKQR